MRRLFFFYVPLRYFEGNKWSKNVIQGLLLCIICLNFIILTIPIQDDSFLESDDIITQLLKGFGLEKKEKQSYQSIPALLKDNIQDSPSFNNRFRLSSHYVPGWADTRWQFRKNITIDNTKVSSDLTNFPVYIELYDSDLQQKAQASGNDILFTNASGHILDHELEVYDRVYNSSHARLVAWVKTNLSGTQDTVISMYYGNSTALNQENPEDLWDSNYMMVQHLQETDIDGGSGDIKDSSSGNNDGTTIGMDTSDQVDGKIDGSFEFDGVNDNIATEENNMMAGLSSFTISAWIKPQASQSDFCGIVEFDNTTDGNSFDVAMELRSTRVPRVNVWTTSGFHYLDSSTVLPTTSFTYFVFTYNGDLTIYLDGSFDSSTSHSGTIRNNYRYLNIGRNTHDGSSFNGIIDEVRISNVVRSVEWIQTEYNNQEDPNSFYSLNTEERYSDTTEWQFPGFKYRKEININSGKVSGSSLSNFPVLIDFKDTDLHYPQAVQPDGDDILFCDASGAKLDHEIEFFDQVGNGTHARLVAWIRIPTLSGTTDTQIFIYFGNPAASSQESPSSVWDGNYVGVWHLNEATGGIDAIKDSTANDNHGTDYNSPAFGQTGKIHNAIAFDGSNQYIELPNSATLIDITEGDYTYEVWFYADQVPPGTGSDNDARYAAQIKSDPHGGCYYDNDSTFTFEHWLSGPTNTAAKTTTTYNPQSFYHVVGVVSKTNGYTKIYVNGTLEDTDTWTAGSNAHDYVTTLKFGIGNPGAAIYRWCLDGKLDEMRVSNTTRSSNWISTEYNNQYDPTSFYSVNSLEIKGNWSLPYLRYKKEITINSSQVSGSGNFYDFPILIELNDSDLHMTDKVQSDGDDIAFTAANGARLDHEIELFDQNGNGTHAHLIVWVKVPILKTTTDTKIYMWYGNSAVPSLANPDGVWNNYGAVWHLHDDFLDSTSNNNDGTNYQSADVGAQIADGQDFDGVDDNINAGSGSSIDNIFNTGATISAWIYPEDWGGGGYGRILDKSSATWGENGWAMCIDGTEDHSPTTNHLLFYRDFSTSRGLWYTPHNSISLNEWQYVTVTFDDSSDSNVPLIYINGVLQSLTPDPVASGTAVDDSGQSLYLGDFIGGGRTFNGVIDEVRLSTSIHSLDWIRTEYANQFNPKNYISVSNETERQWFDGSFNFNKDILINHSKVLEEFSNFPVLIELTNSDFKSGKIQPNASDILFIDSLGEKLDHDIESFTQTGSDGHLTAWVRVPYLSNAEDTVITMYYGNSKLSDQENPEKVWDSNFEGVWHLSEDPSGVAPQMFDSTSNNYDGSVNGGMTSTDQINGQIGGSLDFDGTDDSINTSYAGISGSAARTISFWLNTASLSDRDIFNYGDYDQNRFNIRIDESTTIGDWVIRLEMKDATTIREQRWSTHIADGNWHHIAVVIPQSVDISQTLCYIDGQQDTIDMTSGTGIADSGSGGSYNVGIARFLVKPVFLGILDEVRISTINFPSDWITTEYNNQYAPTSFYSVGTEFSLDTTPPEINTFGVDDPGTGTGIFWADVTDVASNVTSVTININSSEYDMSYNGSSWIYSKSVVFGASYEYQITNASDSRGNYITNPSSIKLHNFTTDNSAPNVDEWDYFDNIGPYGTFKANVSDSWGVLDTVIINVTELNSVPRNDLWAVMVLTASGYMNDTISMPGGSTFWYVITVNDTAGNSNTTTPVPDVVPDFNSPPEAQNVTLSRDIALVLLPVFSNCTLYLHYDFYDADMDSEGGTEIRWYKNGLLQSTYNDSKQITNTSALIKGDQWYATVRPKDGQDFGTLETTPTITIQNTPPVVESVTIPASISTDDLIFSNVTTDEDSDPIVSYEIKWYRNSTYLPSYDNFTTITSDNTKKGESWSCNFRVYDGTNHSQWVSSNTIIIGNTPPVASNLGLSPLNPNTSSILTASWTFSDNDNDIQVDYYITWYRWETHQPTYDNLINLPSAATAKNQEWYFKLIVYDGESNSTEYSSSKVTILNTPPTASGLTITLDPYTDAPLVADWTFIDDDGDSQPANSWIVKWYKNNVLQSGYTNQTTVPASATNKGEMWNYTLKVYDGTNYSIQYSSSITIIQNSIPIASDLTITSSPTTSDDLTASWTFNDIDGDSENTSWLIHWYKDNTLVSAYDNQTALPSSETSKGEVWNYTVQVYDGEDYSIQYNSTTTIIINTPPTASGVTIIPTTLYTSNDLEANWTFADVDSDSQINYYIEWYKGVTHQPAYDNMVILPSTATTKNQVWYFKLTVNDGTDNSTVYSSTSVDILNTPPTASDLTLTSNPPTNVDLQASWSFNDADGDSESTSWIVRWYKNGILQPAQNDSKTISSSLTSKGEIWNYTVRVYDGSDYSIQYNSSIIIIQNSIPTASSLTITSNPTTSDDLSASWTFNDIDGDSENSSWIIHWYKDNTLVSAYDNQTTVLSSATSKGEEWNYTVQVYDGEDYSIQYNSSITIILNSVPTISGQPSFNKTSGVTEADTLNITYTYNDADSDAEVTAGRIVYWYKDGSYNATKDNDTILDSSETKPGEWYYYIIRVSDGIGYSQNYTSEPVTIGGGQTNDPPVAENLTLTLNPTTIDNLIANYDYYDNDSDEEAGTQIRWYKDGILQPDLNDTKTVSASDTTKGEEWYFTVRPKDGLEFGTLVQSSNVTILNTPPSASGLTITQNPKTTDNLVADWSFSDVDGDGENTSWLIHWYKDNTLISTYDNQTTVPSSATSKGEEWNYTVQVFDGENYSIQYSSSITTILNTIPTASGLDLTNNPLTTDSLTANYTYADADNDLESSAWKICWYKDNVLQPGLNDTKTITSGNTSKNEFWHFTLQVHDGESYSTLYTSPSRKILNTPPTASGLTLTSNPPTNVDLQASWSFNDVDGDSESTSWIVRWYKNGILQPAQNDSKTIASSLTSKGEIWNYTVRVYDGSDYSIQYNSSVTVIQNSIPTASSLTITSNPMTSDDLTASWTFNDVDGDSENSSWIIHWYKDNTLVSSYNNQTTVPSTATSKGEEWNYTVQVYDGEDYSMQYNSSITIILNSVPVISGQPSFNKTSGVTEDDTVEISIIFNDADGDSEDINERIVYWFRNTAYQSSKLNHSILSWQDTTEGDIWYYIVKVFDGTDYSINYTSISISIGTSANDPPIAENLTITINPTTIDNLMADYDYYDNQSHPEAGSQIRWYKNGLLQTHLNDTKLVPSSETTKGEDWYFTVIPRDGRDPGDLVTSANTTILNSAPTASSYTLTPNPSTTTDLIANWIYYDSDGDTESTNWIIYWYKDGVLQPDQNDSKTIDSSYTSKGEIWNYTLQVFDGENYSIQYSSLSVLIINSIPSVTSHSYDYDTTNSNIDPDYRTNLDDLVFFVEDEDLSITYIFEDADQPIDTDLSLIQWYYQLDSGSWVEIDKYQNLTSVPSSETYPGDHWKCTITVYDGTDFGTTIFFPEIKIESRPRIETPPQNITTVLTDTEGHFLFNISATNSHNEISAVVFTFDDISFGTLIGQPNIGGTWSVSYQIPADILTSYLNSNITGQVKVICEVMYDSQKYEIFTIQNFSFSVQDLVAPRISDTYHIPNGEPNPTNISFYARVQEYGSGIEDVILYYYFEAIENQGGSGSTLLQTELAAQMTLFNESTTSNLFAVTVAFHPNGTNWRVIYRISTSDKAGNVNPNSFNVLLDDSDSLEKYNIPFNPPGLPEWVLFVAALAVFIIFVGAIVYVKFIRKPEIVGLDKELVLKSLSEVSETEVMESLDAHTIGIVISFFDQRHGPIPIIVIPEILRDNFTKLVELSDRSFSGTGFSDNFEEEITSSYDFVLAQGLRSKVMSFGFALERPEARGGQENLTANVLIHSDLFPLVNQFLDEIQEKVHAIHMMMNSKDSDKKNIRRRVFELRKYVSLVILSYEGIYGTTELISEEK